MDPLLYLFGCIKHVHPLLLFFIIFYTVANFLHFIIPFLFLLTTLHSSQYLGSEHNIDRGYVCEK